ncbi:hypothetical protein [Lacticaseibacillus paracasei]|uniref:hypothetical protein n=1 Tax=Lacticaseibacillus paracasei TaxID=1597 RepID=UPI000F43D382|nr:hypothetical protein [Lacticaseibacillus paracasei]
MNSIKRALSIISRRLAERSNRRFMADRRWKNAWLQGYYDALKFNEPHFDYRYYHNIDGKFAKKSYIDGFEAGYTYNSEEDNNHE